MMTWGNWIALYAALVGTGSLLWQVVTRLLERRPRIRVRARFTFFLPDRETIEKSAGRRSTLLEQPWQLQADVLNVGRAEVRVGRIWFETLRKQGSVSHWTSPSWDLPWLLQPGEERTVILTDDDAGHLVQGQTFMARVVTTRGVEFRSDLLDLAAPSKDFAVVMRAGDAQEFLDRMGDNAFTLHVHEFHREEPGSAPN